MQDVRFEQFTTEDDVLLLAAHAIRREVFVIEQSISEADEWDEADGAAVHVLMYLATKPIGTARVRVMERTAKLERIAIVKAYRGQGYGEALMHYLLGVARAHQCLAAKLSAQVQAQAFYKKLGFAVRGDVYDEAGIPHVLMQYGDIVSPR